MPRRSGSRTARSPTTPSWWWSFRRAVSWHRRKLAALAAAVAVVAGISAARPEPPATVNAVASVRSLPAGTTLTDSDLEVRRVPVDQRPDGSYADPGLLAGRSTAGPVAAGQLLAEAHLLTVRAPVRPGRVVLPVRLADPDVVALVRVGDRLDVLAAASDGATARVVARDVLVVGLPRPGGDSDRAPDAGPLALVETDEGTATRLAGAQTALTVLWG